MSESKPQLEYLYKALEDAQNTIRFTDTKAGIIIVASGVLSAYLVPLGRSLIDNIKNPLTFYSLVTFVVAIICLVSFLFTLLITIKAINPMSSPVRHIFMDGLTTKVPFYLYKIDPEPSLWDCLSERNNSKLDHSSNEIFESLMKDQNSEEITKSLVLEVCKVSYIREKKIYRVNMAFVFFALGFITLFISSIMLHSIQWI
ncbi:hypothetical protein Desaci_4759 (plasmid) [Desulfosporosinus acidiphilus SJ4]|uniref:Pycsar effector protein domain-containing protein n=1 Tax=Desulfosporosinus acidiphilus (strain DSM 22704 / JCM 16185 / SJ4) TaxID=646529 RepID=I4DCR1_DESAJ|nr:hypothetical protein [Desulfosporosinus acidiphilus]AFM43585.1 hypothetical protein Desaci_4759 [Desulfosporosinus acidiphilus SJ4]